MFSVFQQPFPFETSLRVKLIRAGLIGVFVGLFLVVFEPFGIQRWQTPDKPVKLLGFGLISGLLTAGHFLIWPRLFPHGFAESRWTVGRMIMFIIGLILSIAVANLLYMSILVGDSVNLVNLLQAIGVTFLIGIFPITGAVLATYVVRLRTYMQSARELSQRAATPEQDSAFATHQAPDMVPNADITFTADTGKDALTLIPTDLLYIESSDNYATVVYLKQNVPTRALLRNTLSRLETQAAQPDIVRCHRSFVVNLNRIERVTGNAQGYRLHLFGGQFVVPVARQYNATLVAQLK